MTTYAIGDVQGCFDQLQAKLKEIQFNPKQDTLWFVGDIVNRGPKSLETLRFIKNLGEKASVVLGNHDLHLLAVYFARQPLACDDTIQDILDAPDCDALCHWLRHQPLFHYDEANNIAMVHAGLIPEWTAADAKALASEVEAVLRGDDYISYLKIMYGNQPDTWSDDLTGQERLRFITNVMTRIRFCSSDGQLDLQRKGGPEQATEYFKPWFEHPNRASLQTKLIFGHWAALGGIQGQYNVWGLDTGCVWGGNLTVLRINHRKLLETR